MMLVGSGAIAQKMGYIDLSYIISKMPEYKEAQREIDELSAKWQNEIVAMSKEIDAQYASLQAEEVLLTKEMKEERINAIKKKEADLKEYQKKVFGFEGLLFLKKKELIEPVQSKVFDAVDRVARKQKLQFIFDKSAELVMVYTDPRHDYTDFVLEELGLGDPNDTVKK
jgi:outer membrane protein